VEDAQGLDDGMKNLKMKRKFQPDGMLEKTPKKRYTFHDPFRIDIPD